MPTTKTGRGRDEAQRDAKRPISLRAELTILIVVSSVLAFVLAWIATMLGLNGWIALPVAIAATLVFTYFTSRHLTSPLAQMIDAAQAMAEGGYSARVHIKKNSRDEVGELADAFNIMADELEHADQTRRDMIANVSHELRTPVSALQAMVENTADGIVEPTPANLESILTQTPPAFGPHLVPAGPVTSGGRRRKPGNRANQPRRVHQRDHRAARIRGRRPWAHDRTADSR